MWKIQSYIQNFPDNRYIRYISNIHKELKNYIDNNRIIFIPNLSIEDRYNFMKICDIILDTPTNVTPLYCLFAIKAKKPFITYPQIYYNTRIPYSIFKRLNQLSYVAISEDNYVKIASDVSITKMKGEKNLLAMLYIMNLQNKIIQNHF